MALPGWNRYASEIHGLEYAHLGDISMAYTAISRYISDDSTSSKSVS